MITSDELRFFYRSQLHRISSLVSDPTPVVLFLLLPSNMHSSFSQGQETVSFDDVMCQMIDMIAPEDEHAITLADLLNPIKRAYSGVLFDVLFNLHKFMRFETRDPFQEKQRREDMFACDWDRFAHIEYHRLAAEEDDGYDSGGGMEVEEGKFGGDGFGGGNADWLIDDDDDDDDLAMSGGGMDSKRGAKGSKGMR